MKDEYTYRVKDTGMAPRQKPVLCRLTQVSRCGRKMAAYMDRLGYYWLANSPSIEVERVA